MDEARPEAWPGQSEHSKLIKTKLSCNMHLFIISERVQGRARVTANTVPLMLFTLL